MIVRRREGAWFVECNSCDRVATAAATREELAALPLPAGWVDESCGAASDCSRGPYCYVECEGCAAPGNGLLALPAGR